MLEEPNPYNPPHKEAKVDLIGIWRYFKDKSRAKLRAKLKASRERYRRALRYKEHEMTEAELYEDMEGNNG